jgi:hypothetical protein
LSPAGGKKTKNRAQRRDIRQDEEAEGRGTTPKAARKTTVRRGGGESRSS